MQAYRCKYITEVLFPNSNAYNEDEHEEIVRIGEDIRNVYVASRSEKATCIKMLSDFGGSDISLYVRNEKAEVLFQKIKDILLEFSKEQ